MAEPLDQDFQKRLVEGYGDCYALSQVRLFKKGFFRNVTYFFIKFTNKHLGHSVFPFM